MKKYITGAFLTLFIAILFSSCGPSAIVVRTRPAPPLVVRPFSPGPGYIWIEGEWVRGGHGYVYRQGYWAPPRAYRSRWVGGHWQARRHGWVWVGGHWY